MGSYQATRNALMNADFSPDCHTASLNTQCINTLHFLSVDAVQKADSGHPGSSMRVTC
jgi:hypothetical protein